MAALLHVRSKAKSSLLHPCCLSLMSFSFWRAHRQVGSLPEAAREALGLFQGSKLRAQLPFLQKAPFLEKFLGDGQFELSLSQDLGADGIGGFLEALR